jgi:uncharacterized protein (DUF4415 family)
MKGLYMKTRLEQIEYLKNLKDEDIDYSDAPQVTDFTNWEPNPFFKPVKAQLSAKVDKDILAWLKMHGEVSKFLNKILREKMFEERHNLAQG